MKKVLFVLFVLVLATGMSFAQQLAGQDILGPHNVNGHGCASCHAPHSGAKGNGGSSAQTGETYLWGRDFYATTYYTFGNVGNQTNADSFQVTAAGFADTDPLFHTAACLTCHDGNQTAVVGMTGYTKEKVDGVYSVPTYLNDGTESLKNDHPVHAAYDVTSPYNWGGTVNTDGSITWTPSNAANAFAANYVAKGKTGGPFRLYVSGTTAYVECSTCHNPHAVNYVKGNYAGGTGVTKATNFFVRGWYNTDNPNSNSGQQFCRSCHYSKSNEYVGVNGIITTGN